ncbi:MAG: hypothetical protein IIZ40_03995 [Bacilli bacterium]|nr:hypothetical protein [Bacilli bacterium]
MRYFNKEKDTFLKVINALLIIGAILSVVIMVATGIQLLNKNKVLSYKDYAKKVCTIDKLEYECLDESCIKELDIERKKTCTNYYLDYKKEQDAINKKNINNFFISLGTSIILFISLHLLNKKI